MSLAYDILYAQKCRSTHHKLAMDALRQLRLPDRQRWEDLFLYYIDWYLEGAKAPDDKFKDFRNHVLHVNEKFWGGACKLAYDWYGKMVDMLRRRDWPAAVYSAGVMSHYFTDPFMPFHTGQTEAEGNVHRAVEWSICKSYDSLRRLTEARGYPTFELSQDPDDWMGEMIRRGAIAANRHYEVCIDHYNLDLGSKNPPAGLDDEMRERIAEQLGLATVGLARILERAFVDASATPDSVPVALTMAISTLETPVRAVKDFVRERADRIQIEEMYAEFKVTGKVVNTLPEDDRAVRKAHAAEVLEVPMFLLDAEKTRPPGQKHGTFEPVQPKTTLTGNPVRRRYDINGVPLDDHDQPIAVRRYDAPLSGVPAASSSARTHLSDASCRCPSCSGTGSLRPTRTPLLVGARSVTVGSTPVRSSSYRSAGDSAQGGYGGSLGTSTSLGSGTTSGGSNGQERAAATIGDFGGSGKQGTTLPPEAERKRSPRTEIGTPAENQQTAAEIGSTSQASPSRVKALVDSVKSTFSKLRKPSSSGDEATPGNAAAGFSGGDPRAEIDESTENATPPQRPNRDPLSDRSQLPRTSESQLVRTGPNRLTALPNQETDAGAGSTGKNSGTGNGSERERGAATKGSSGSSGNSGESNTISPLLNRLAGGAAAGGMIGQGTASASDSVSSRTSRQGDGTSTQSSNAGADARGTERNRGENDSDREPQSRDYEREEREPRENSSRSSRESRDSTTRSNRRLRFYLDLDDDLEKAPSIGNKTAQRFANIGIRSVRDFLSMDAAAIAAKLNQKGMNVPLLKEWQDQARLAASIPNIRGHDAQILVGCGLRQPYEVASAAVDDLEAFVKEFVATAEGQRVLRGGEMPDTQEISNWIEWAKEART